MLDGAVDPAKAEGLFHRVVVGESCLARGFHGKDEPDLLLCLKVPGKPVPPPLPVGCVKSLHGFHALPSILSADRRIIPQKPEQTPTFFRLASL